jgi:hypothetical protein
VSASQARLDVPVSQVRLVPKPSDVGSPVQAYKIGTDADGSSLGAAAVSKLDCSHAFSLPWEEDLPTSPWEEVSGSGVVATVVALVSEASLAKVVRSSSQAPSLIRRGFFGLRPVSSSSSGAKEASLSSKGKDSFLLEMLSKQDNPPVSKSLLVYSQRVKDEVAKQLLKNKDMLAEVVADIPVEGYPKEMIDMMNFSPVVGLPAIPKVKGKRELKNVECPWNSEARGQRSSQALCLRRRGSSGSKYAFSFPLEVQ